MTRPKPQRTGATIAANEEANDSDSETVGSDRDSQADFDTPDQEHNDTEPEDRRVILNLRDNHDDGGEGMLVQMPWLGCFKNVFDHFKALSCSTCRTPGEMRFKTQTATVSDNTTPADVRNPRQTAKLTKRG